MGALFPLGELVPIELFKGVSGSWAMGKAKMRVCRSYIGAVSSLWVSIHDHQLPNFIIYHHSGHYSEIYLRSFTHIRDINRNCDYDARVSLRILDQIRYILVWLPLAPNFLLDGSVECWPSDRQCNRHRGTWISSHGRKHNVTSVSRWCYLYAKHVDLQLWCDICHFSFLSYSPS